MNHDLTSIGPRPLSPAAVPAAVRPDASVPAAARGVAFAVVFGLLAFGAGPVHYLLTRQLPEGTEVAGAALLAAVALCYLKVMCGALTGTAPRAQAVNLTTLALCTIFAPMPLGRSWLALGFILPAAASSGIRWPTGLWLGLGAVPAAFATATTLGESAAAAARAVAQDSLVASALTVMVMFAMRSDELGQLKAAMTALTDSRAGTEQRLRQANDLLGILGWRLSVISRMSDLTSTVADERPALARQVLGDLHRLAVEWPRGPAAGPAAGGASELSAEIGATRPVLAAAGIGCEFAAAPADLPAELGDLLAFAVRQVALGILRRPGARTCQVRVLEGHSRVSLDVTCDGSPGGRDAPGGNVLADRMADAGGQCTYTEGDRGFRLHIELPHAAPEGGPARHSSGQGT